VSRFLWLTVYNLSVLKATSLNTDNQRGLVPPIAMNIADLFPDKYN